MWILLIIAFLSLWLLCVNVFSGRDWRSGFLYAMILFQLILVAATEILSLFDAVTLFGLSAVWLLVIFFVGAMAWRSNRQGKPWRMPIVNWPDRFWLWLVDGMILFILLTTFAVAVAAPPNTADSLVYHLPRMAHWAQNGSVAHFPAGNEFFNSHPPSAEMLMLHFYILFQGDRLINLQGWLAFLTGMLAVGALSQTLGIGKVGQHFAVLFAAAMPVAIAHASSTKNDLAAASWVIVVAWVAFRYLVKTQKSRDLLFLAGAVGLALLTKEYTLVFLAPFGLWFAVRLFKTLKWRPFLLWAAIIVLIVVGLNAGYLIRNLRTYGELADPVAVNHFRVEEHSLPAYVSNVIKNVSLHAQTPWPWSRTWIYQRILTLHDWLGVDPNNPGLTVECDYEVPGFITSEILSGNPLHITLILMAFVVVWVMSSRWKVSGDLIGLSLTALAAFLLFSILFKWQCFGARYHFSFFFLSTPLVAFLISKLDRKGWITGVLGLVMLALAGLWLFSLRPRPIIPWPGMTKPYSVFEDRTRLYYPDAYAYQMFTEMAEVVEASGCKDIGLRLRGSSMEYLYWMALGAPRSDYHFECLVAGTPSAVYEDPDFSPCAVICEDCAATRLTYNDLVLAGDYSFFRLYLRPSE